MLGIILFAIIGYFIGSIPWGVIISRVFRGIDVRQYGSGGMGATNVLRTLGPVPSMLVFLLDFLKGVLAVLLASWLAHSLGAQIAGALGALLGHNWPLFAGFRGGRGVTTSLGGLFVLVPWAGVAALGAGVIIILLFKYVSVGSLAGTITGAVAVILMVAGAGYHWSFLVYAPLATALIVFQHRYNIGRLIKGLEPKLNLGASRRSP